MILFCDVKLGIKEDHYTLLDEFGNIVVTKRMPIHNHYRACIVHYELENRGRWKTPKRHRVTWFKDPEVAREYFESFGGYSHYKGIWLANPTNTVQTSTKKVLTSHKLSGGIYKDDTFAGKNRSSRR